jgi:hypothetical protein
MPRRFLTGLTAAVVLAASGLFPSHAHPALASATASASPECAICVAPLASGDALPPGGAAAVAAAPAEVRPVARARAGLPMARPPLPPPARGPPSVS